MDNNTLQLEIIEVFHVYLLMWRVSYLTDMHGDFMMVVLSLCWLLLGVRDVFISDDDHLVNCGLDIVSVLYTSLYDFERLFEVLLNDLLKLKKNKKCMT